MTIFDNFLAQANNSLQSLGTQLKDINSYRKELDSIIKKALIDFKIAIKKNDVAYVKEFLETDIPLELYTNIIPQTFINEYSLEMNLVWLHLIKKQNLSHYINSSSNTLVSKKSFSENTSKLQWLLKNNPSFFKQHYAREVYENWGSIYFDPEKHELLGKFIIQTHPKPEVIIKNITSRPMDANFPLLEYFEKQLLTKRKFIISEQLASYCLNYAIQNANLNHIQYFLAKGTLWPESKANYSALMTSSYKKEHLMDVLKIIKKDYNLYYENHVLFRTIFHYIDDMEGKNLKCLKEFLTLYDHDKLTELNPIIDKKIKSNKIDITKAIELKDYINKYLLYKRLNEDIPQAEKNVAKVKI